MPLVSSTRCSSCSKRFRCSSFKPRTYTTTNTIRSVSTLFFEPHNHPHQRQPLPLKTDMTTINNKIPIIHSSHLSSQFVDHLDGNAEVTLQRANKCEIILFVRLIIVWYSFYSLSFKCLITFQFSLLFLRQNLILSPASLFSLCLL